MKKKIIFIMMILITVSLFAEDAYKMLKIKDFSNDKQFYRRKEEQVAPQDDDTGNYLKIDESGKMYVFNSDNSYLIELSEKLKVYEYDFSDIQCLYGIERISEKYFYYRWISSSLIAIEKQTGERKFKVDIISLIRAERLYYDEESDILFLQDKNEQLYSIINPGLDEEQNKKNFKTPEETLAMLKEGKYSPHLGTYKEKFLTVDGQVYYWEGKTIGKADYQILQGNRVYIYGIGSTIKIPCSDKDNLEQIESIAIHPSGDIYVLRMNWTTNTHNLYRIENTWDPQWRAQWYKEHPEAE